MIDSFRMESDIIGEKAIPRDAYYGINSLRAQENFPITGRNMLPQMIVSLAWIKKACARANRMAGVLQQSSADAIETACDEVIAGRWHDQFIVDAVQGGAGTSANMNANEVIANRANVILGGKPGDYSLVSPNDHVNAGQSTNDVYPTSGKMTAYHMMNDLLQELDRLVDAMNEKAAEFDLVVKMGRTQLQDAVPIRLGQEFGAYAAVLSRERKRLKKAQEEMLCLNLGGTAVGTGINADPEFMKSVVGVLAEMTATPYFQDADLVDGTQNLDAYVVLSSALKGCGISLSKICNDLRLMSSGPKAGLDDINLPPRQNGSSIMPGKVNPVIPEVVSQIAFRLIGFDVTVSMAVEAGQMELNAFEPIIFDSLFQGIAQFTGAIRTLTDHCIKGITANESKCRSDVDHSIGLVTALVPVIGYKKASMIAKEALRTNVSVRELVIGQGLLTPEEAEKALDPLPMTGYQPKQ